jgi:AraC-like DNA-binding protein
MPIFMDLHIIPGVTAKDVAEAHCEDIKIQEKYNCKCMTYWIDEKRDSVFCLIDAPNKEAIRKLHDGSHGLIPHEIIPVNDNLVEAFLGRLQDPDTFNDLSNPELNIFNDPAFRIILVTKIMDSTLLINTLGTERAERLQTLHDEIVKDQLKNFDGSAVEFLDDGCTASFESAAQALQCACAIEKSFHVAGDLVNLQIGLHAGMPVSKNNLLFGDTVKFAKNLCFIGKKNQILVSSIVHDTYMDEDRDKTDELNNIKWLTPSEDNFLKKLLEVLDRNWKDPKLEIDDFCREMSMSTSKLYRKCKDLTGMSINSLLREYRLLNSLQQLKRGEKNITQIAFDSGFNSSSYFTRCFQKRFGSQPTAFLQN